MRIAGNGGFDFSGGHMRAHTASLVVALIFVPTATFAQNSAPLAQLSPATRAELLKLSPSERAALARQLLGNRTKAVVPATAAPPIAPPPPVVAKAAAAPPLKTDGNDFLCTNSGCVGGTLMIGAGAFGAEPQGTYPDNFGAFGGGNAAAPIPVLEAFGFGAQLAATAGVYNFGGKVSPGATLNEMSSQSFLSAGLFRRPDPYGPLLSRFGVGFVYDVSFNNNMNTFGQNYTLEQWRLKASYDITPTHEVGVWAAIHANSVTCATCAFGTPNTIRSLDQLNFFYKYNLADGGFVDFYAGPGIDHFSIAPNGFAVAANYQGLKWTIGADASVPISDYFAVFADVAYGAPNANPAIGFSPAGGFAGAEQAWMAMAGLRFYWGGNARVHEDTGRHWMPYLADPNNGSMFQFANKTE
jgi:hypothetical protein